MTMNRVTLITLGVRDLERSRAYYEKLGWALETALETVAFYNMGGMKFGLFPVDMLAGEQGRKAEALGNGMMTLAQNFPSETEVDLAHSAALDAGATEITKPARTEWGGYSGYVADLDGHVWEFAHNPLWPLDDEGRLA